MISAGAETVQARGADLEGLLRQHTARTGLPALQHDPNRPEDLLKADADEEGNEGDDAADTPGDILASKGRSVSVRKWRGL